MRRLSHILIIAAIVLGGLYLAARWYLSSSSVARQAAEQLAKLYGGPVDVEHANIGLRSSTLSGVRLHEAGSPTGTPWLTVGSLNADVSLWDLVSGNGMPRHIKADKATVLLRFDPKGGLLTSLPGGAKHEIKGPLPDVELRNSRITLRREGGADVVVSGVTGTLRPEGGQYVLSAEGSNPQWGKLTVGGKIDPKSGSAAVDLKSAGTVHVTQKMLDDLPFLSPSIWQEVKADGDTPVDVKLSYDPAAKKLHYHVGLEPKDTQVIIPAADLRASKASGQLVIDDGLVKLRHVKGTAYEGSLALEGDLDFRGQASRLDFSRVEARGLDVHRLPPNWGLPKEIEGKLDASGTVDLTIAKGHISTGGDMKAEIRNARLAGQPADGPIQIDLSPEGPPLQVGSPTGAGELAQEPKTPPPPPRKQRPTFLTVKLKLKDADIAQMVQKLDLKLPMTVGGRLNFQGQASIPMNEPREAKDYRFTGSAVVTKAQIGDAVLERIEAEARYDKGVLRLDKLYGIAPGAPIPKDKAEPGTFRGGLVAQIAPPGDLTADLTINRVPLQQAAKELGLKKDSAGELTGSLSLRLSLARLEKDKQWDGAGKIVVSRASAYGWTLKDAGVDVKFQGDQLKLTDLHGNLEGTEITGSGDMTLKEPYPYKARIDLPNADLAAVGRLAEELRPTIHVSGRATLHADLSGTMKPFHIESTGTADLTGLKVDQLKFQEIKLGWQTDLERLTVKDLKTKLYGGEVTGGAVVPLKADAVGKVDLTLKNIDVGQLLKEADVGLPIEGQAGGTVKGTLPAAPPGKPRPVDLTLNLQAPHLKVKGIDAEGLHGKVRYAGEDIDYKFEAKALGGTVEVEGTVPRTSPKAGEETGKGKLRVHGLRLDRLGPAFGAHRYDWPLSGRLDARVNFRYEGPDRSPVGDGYVTVRDLAWDGHYWFDQVTADVVMANDRLVVRDVSAALAGGSVRAGMSLSWKHPQLNHYTLNVYQLDAERLLAAWPELKGRIQGRISGGARGRIGRELTSYGALAVARGKVGGVEVANWRLPFRAVYLTRARRGRVDVQGATGTVAMGRVTGEASYNWGWTKQLQGKLQFSNVDLRGILHAAAESAYLGGGKITGRLDFSGPGLVGLDQLSAYLDARLVQVQANQYPVFRQLLPTLGLNQSSSFQSGLVRARLAGGVVRVERLSLQGGPGDIYATGTVTTQGRLGLEVHASARWAGVSANRLPLSMVSSIPARAVGRLSNNLTRGLIHARVTGTIRAPTVQIMPVRMIQEEAARFFLGRA